MDWKSGEVDGDEIQHIDLVASFCLSSIFYAHVCLLLFVFVIDAFFDSTKRKCAT